MKYLPRNPTKGMLDAGSKLLILKHSYQAMYDAAPKNNKVFLVLENLLGQIEQGCEVNQLAKSPSLQTAIEEAIICLEEMYNEKD